MSIGSVGAYAGDVSPDEAWSLLSDGEPAALVDVRTRPEWAYVGTPDLSTIGRSPILAEWQTYPSMAVDPAFVETVVDALEAAGVGREAPVVFLCRSGVRSRAAAIAMTAAGWQRCLNVAGGFEGPVDPTGRRGAVAGWKACGLPWSQT
jgi:rhodanese-related sulfurtransferase